MFSFLRVVTGSCAIAVLFGSADSASNPAAEVTDSFMNFRLLACGFFIAPQYAVDSRVRRIRSSQSLPVALDRMYPGSTFPQKRR